MQQLISIIIPTYNRAHIIGETLDSLLAQSYTNWECIVVDDGSTDATATLLAKYIAKDGRFRFYKRPETEVKGPSSCRNYGFQHAHGDYVQWFDSDDVYLPNALEQYIDAFDKENYDVVVAKLDKVDSETQKVIGVNAIVSQNVIPDYFTGKIAYYVCGPMWEKQFLHRQPLLFDTAIHNLDDWDFNLRMLYQKPKISLIDKPLMLYRIHAASLSKEIEKFNFDEIQSEIKARDKHLQLLKSQNFSDMQPIEAFYIARLAHFFRESMVTHQTRRFYFLKAFCGGLWRQKAFGKMIRIIFGFVVFLLFKKGYKLLT